MGDTATKPRARRGNDTGRYQGGRAVTTDIEGVNVIRYRDGHLRYLARMKIGGRMAQTHHETVEAAIAWRESMRPAQEAARAARARRRSAQTVQQVQGEEARKLTRMLGLHCEARREFLSTPIDEDPIYDLALGLRQLLGRNLTLDECGVLYGITREGIRLIEVKALRKIREKRALHDWREHIEDILAHREGADEGD